MISAYGTAVDRQLGIPGEDLPGSHSATEFVNWYNAHPDFADHDFDLSVKRAVVIGNGNVAADVARMLALPHGELNDHRHRQPRDREARRLRGRGDRRPRSPRPGPGRVHQPRGPRARRAHRRRHRHRPGRDGARPREPRLLRVRRLRSHQPPQRRDLHRVLPAPARGQAEAGRDALLLLAGRDPGRGQGREHRRSAATRSTPTSPAASAPSTPASARRSSAAWCCARSATRGPGSRGSRSTPRAALIPNESGRVLDPERASRSPATTPSAGSSAARRASSGRTRRTRSTPSARSSPTSRRPRSRSRRPPAEVDRPELPGRARRRSRHLRGLAGDRPRRGAAGEPHGRPRVKFCRVHEMVEASRQARGPS